MKILVTGHSGLLGSWLCKRLVNEGHEVHGFSRTDRNHTHGVIPHLFDLRNTERAATAIQKIAPEIIFHLAANAAENASVFSPIEITTTGINTFLNVLVPGVKAGNLKKFNFTSSIAVYGAIPTPFRERDSPMPRDIYGVVKLGIERMLEVMADVHQFKYSITRPHNVFGPGQNMADPYRNVVTLFMNSLLKHTPYSVYGDGSMTRCFSYVEDVVEVIFKAGMDSKTGLTLNVGSDQFYTLQELSQKVQNISGIRIQPEYLPLRVHEVHTAIADHSIAKSLYGYHTTPLEVGLKKTWDWVKSVGPVQYVYKELEIPGKDVPANWKTEDFKQHKTQ